MSVKVVLKENRERTVCARHPWIFSGAIGSVEGSPENGQPVRVFDFHGSPLGWGAFSADSNIRIRMWNYDDNQQVNSDFVETQIRTSISRRGDFTRSTNAYRIIYAESDGLPGLIVDKYGGVLVVQFLSAGSEYFRNVIVDILRNVCRPEMIYERSDVEVRKLEGLPQKSGYLFGEGRPTQIQIVENDITYIVDVAKGQKTGFYLDQRHNRKVVSSLSAGRECLNCFCYTGGFSLGMMKNGAGSVVSIDSSQEALSNAVRNVEINGLTSVQQEWMEGDVFQQLRKFRDHGRDFDLIVLDPPKFAPTRAQVERASKAYKDINLLALKLLRKEGRLVTFSCSGGISMDLFQKILAGAAEDARKEVQIQDWLYQDLDHPVKLNFPESSYLKGLVCQT